MTNFRAGPELFGQRPIAVQSPSKGEGKRHHPRLRTGDGFTGELGEFFEGGVAEEEFLDAVGALEGYVDQVVFPRLGT